MAVNRKPILKTCRELGISPMVMGVGKETKRDPNAGKRKRFPNMECRLKEKQKARFIYGVLEKQFSHTFEIAQKMEGQAGENLITCLESRLDNVAFRMGAGSYQTRRLVRLVAHGHFLVNGKRVDIPSYSVKVGDVISFPKRARRAKNSSRSPKVRLTDSLPLGLT